MTLPGPLSPHQRSTTILWSTLQPVLAPFLLSRGLVLVVIALSQLLSHGIFDPNAAALSWDGAWFANIAMKGYGFRSFDLERMTPFPFFPLFPLLLRLSDWLGLPIGISGAVINQVGLLFGLSFVRQLGLGRVEPSALVLAIWLMAFFPGTAAFSLCYSDGLFLALSTGALLCQDKQKYRFAGVIAAAAALTRPNGMIVSFALAGASFRQRGCCRQVMWLLLPAVGLVLGWTSLLWQFSGYPLVWIQAKQAWREVSLLQAFTNPDIFRDFIPELLFSSVFVWLALRKCRCWPLSWTLFALLCIFPSFATGLVGMPRYLVSCFPAFFGLGQLLSRRFGWTTLWFSVSCFGLAKLVSQIIAYKTVP